jgi:acyl-CoA thioester hydrolase
MWNFFKTSGLLDVMKEAEVSPVILESTQRYIHELKLLDEVRIDSEFTCSGGILSYKHIIINNATGLVSCKVKGKLAYINKEHIICDVPDAIREHIKGEN